VIILLELDHYGDLTDLLWSVLKLKSIWVFVTRWML